ncbi:hypothetical protein ALC57_09610 [Trachymyrmex cornetzi]|uniref:Helix-turn-helix domain-containing protein n=1 Tax=Trachymyrmex cornetzi TaxID=471704 RepID=A0A195DZG7_9HYME|nr:hypothetical protein ALC57_09610 [Trachymyrmex cornetzi]
MFNSFHPRLQFTLKIGGDRIDFLDITIIKMNHRIWVDRVVLLSHPRYHSENIRHIMSILINNDYPTEFIFNTINSHLKFLFFNKKNTPWLLLLYIPTITDEFKRIMRSFNIKLAFKSLNKLSRYIKKAINPRVSTRQIERELGIPKSTSHRILTTHNFHPYHITLTQQLTLNDFQQRLEFCRWAQIMLNRDRTFFRFVLFNDEATFHNTGQLNRHNSHYWSVENPRWYREVNHQHRWSLIVWCGILNGNLISPYFFEENVNGNNYLHFLQQRLPALLEDIDLDTRQRMFFQQDGAPAHWSRRVRNHLDLTFPGRWIGRGVLNLQTCHV